MTTKPEPVTCPRCGRLIQPFFVQPTGHWVHPACDCTDQLLAEEKVRREQEDRQRRTRHLFNLSQLEGRFSDATFSTWRHSPETEHAYKAATQYVEHWPERRAAGDGLMFVGDAGTGKTRLAASIVRALVEQEAAAVFQSVPTLLARIRASYGGSGAREAQLMAALLDADLVVLDDLGAEQVTDWTLDRLFVVIDTRYLRRAPVIVTSNLLPNALIERMGITGARLVDRLSETCRVINFEGESQRKKRALERRNK
jgi:DNA replication protein DnaC